MVFFGLPCILLGHIFTPQPDIDGSFYGSLFRAILIIAKEYAEYSDGGKGGRGWNIKAENKYINSYVLILRGFPTRSVLLTSSTKKLSKVWGHGHRKINSSMGTLLIYYSVGTVLLG